MRKTLFISFLFLCAICKAQTTILPTTTIQQLSWMKTGTYEFTIKGAAGGTDTVTDFGLDSTLIIRFVHDTTIKTVHDTLMQKVDSAAIISTYVAAHPCPVCPVCPPPIVCPVCPPIPKQRTAVGITWDIITNKKTILYDDGTTSTL